MTIKIIVKNKRAGFDFSLYERYEAGIALQGTEVKSLRLGKVSLTEAYIRIDSQNEAWVYNINIPHYEQGNRFNHEENRKRKLLLHKKEIENILQEVKTQKLTIIPTMIYFSKGRIKLEMALAKGKKLHDKRQDQATKDAQKKLRQGDYN